MTAKLQAKARAVEIAPDLATEADCGLGPFVELSRSLVNPIDMHVIIAQPGYVRCQWLTGRKLVARLSSARDPGCVITPAWCENGLAQSEILQSTGFRSLKTGQNSVKVVLPENPRSRIRGQPRALRQNAAKPAPKTNRRLDQPTVQNTRNPSLNSKPGCLKIVDTLEGSKNQRRRTSGTSGCMYCRNGPSGASTRSRERTS
jgi:hypothetical protein